MIQKLRELLGPDPFRPFTVSLAAGRSFHVVSPDTVWLPTRGRGGLHFFVPSKDRIVSVNLLLVTSIDWASPSAGVSSQS